MRSHEARPGARVRVSDGHRVAERRGTVGRVICSYGASDCVAVDVRFADGECRLFWPGDLEEVSPPRRWWRSLLRRGGPR